MINPVGRSIKFHQEIQMSDFAEFALHNALLFLALFVILGLLIGSEVLRRLRGVSTLDAVSALRLAGVNGPYALVLGTVVYRTLTPGTVALWTAGILAGAALGYFLIKQAVITRADAPRSLYRQADYTALPFMMLAFGVKYVLGVMSAVSPQTMQQPAMSALAIVSGGVFAGAFIGKFARYVGVYVARVPV